MAAAEGYGDHVMHAVGHTLLRDLRADRGGDAPLPRERAGRPGVRATPRRRDEARAVPARARPSATTSRSRPTKRRSRGCGIRPRRCRRSPRSTSRGCGSPAPSERRTTRLIAAIVGRCPAAAQASAILRPDDRSVSSSSRTRWTSASGMRKARADQGGIYLSGAPGARCRSPCYRAWKVAARVRHRGGSLHRSLRTNRASLGPAGPQDEGLDGPHRRGGRDRGRRLPRDRHAHLVLHRRRARSSARSRSRSTSSRRPTKLSKEIEDGLKKSDVIWVGAEQPGGYVARSPAWFAYKNGRILVLSQREPGPPEQTVPGLPRRMS